MNALAAAILGYVVLQLAVGLWVARRVRSEDDFFVAGRRLGTWTVAASVFATWFGAETCVSAAGQVSAEGLTRLSVEPYGFGLCLVLVGALLAAPLWRRRITTIADLLRERYGERAERIAAVVTIPTSVLWAAAQIRAFGEILAVSTDLTVPVAITWAAALAIVYTGLGGLLADVVTDVVQGAVLVAGLVVLLAFTVADVGGAGAFAERLARAPVSVLDAGGPGWLETAETWALVVLGSLIAQEVISRTLAARCPRAARNGALLGGGLYLVVGSIPIVLALVAAGDVAAGATGATGATGDAFLPAFAQARLPTALFVLFAGALVSAILSTVDSALLAAAAIGARNLVPRRFVGEAGRLRAARVGVVACGAAAWVLALSADSVFGLIEESSGFASAGVLVALVLALATPWGGAWAGCGALVAGAATWCAAAYGPRAVALPFLTSLAAALVGFAVGAAVDRARARRAAGALDSRSSQPT